MEYFPSTLEENPLSHEKKEKEKYCDENLLGYHRMDKFSKLSCWWVLLWRKRRIILL
jgi:hypothetical protein